VPGVSDKGRLVLAERPPASPLERLSAGWIHPVDKKPLQIQKLEHILVAQIESI
jgi:hypothetical protein